MCICALQMYDVFFFIVLSGGRRGYCAIIIRVVELAARVHLTILLRGNEPSDPSFFNKFLLTKQITYL